MCSRMPVTGGLCAVWNQQYKEDEDNQKHNRPARISAEATVHYNSSLFGTVLQYDAMAALGRDKCHPVWVFQACSSAEQESVAVKGLIVHNESVDNGFETGMQQCE